MAASGSRTPVADHCRRYLIAGRVQGVFYRASAQSIARRLGLTGWVRNLADGRVEVVACGPEDRLAEFKRWLRQGPPQANVSSVDENEVSAQAFLNFEVRESGA